MTRPRLVAQKVQCTRLPEVLVNLIVLSVSLRFFGVLGGQAPFGELNPAGHVIPGVDGGGEGALRGRAWVVKSPIVRRLGGAIPAGTGHCLLAPCRCTRRSLAH